MTKYYIISLDDHIRLEIKKTSLVERRANPMEQIRPNCFRRICPLKSQNVDRSTVMNNKPDGTRIPSYLYFL